MRCLAERSLPLQVARKRSEIINPIEQTTQLDVASHETDKQLDVLQDMQESNILKSLNDKGKIFKVTPNYKDSEIGITGTLYEIKNENGTTQYLLDTNEDISAIDENVKGWLGRGTAAEVFVYDFNGTIIGSIVVCEGDHSNCVRIGKFIITYGVGTW